MTVSTIYLVQNILIKRSAPIMSQPQARATGICHANSWFPFSQASVRLPRRGPVVDLSPLTSTPTRRTKKSLSLKGCNSGHMRAHIFFIAFTYSGLFHHTSRP